MRGRGQKPKPSAGVRHMKQSKPNKRGGKVRRWIEGLLLAVGLLSLGVWGGVQLASMLSQAWENRSFDLKKQQVSAPAASKTRAPERGDVLGRLSIPRLGLSSMVREGDDEGILSLAVGHIPGTSLPGQAGNVAVAAHRDTIFRGLRNIKKDDVIHFETMNGTHDYEVDSIDLVMPDDVSVLKAGKRPQLTLVTCYPFYYVGSAPQRFIVSAHELPAGTEAAELKPAILYAAKKAERDSDRPTRRGAEPQSSELFTRAANFELSSGHGGDIVPGIFVEISSAGEGHADGWVWVMPDRHSIQFKNQAAGKPLIFYQNGERRELVLSGVSGSDVRGALFFGLE